MSESFATSPSSLVFAAFLSKGINFKKYHCLIVNTNIICLNLVMFFLYSVDLFRYSDFIVNEVDLDGNVVHLTSLHLPPEVFSYSFF